MARSASRSGRSWYTALSPDGTKVAEKGVDAEKGNPYIFVIDVARGTRTRLTSHAANEGQPAWSPKGDRLAFISYRNGLSDIFVSRSRAIRRKCK